MASSPPLSHTEAICQAFNSCCCQTPESVCLSTCLVPSLHIHGCFCPISTSCTHEAACTQPPPLSFRTLSTCTDSLKQSPQRGPFGLTSLSLFLPLHKTATTTRRARSWSLLPLPRSSQAPPLSRSACSGSSPALSHPLSSHTCISASETVSLEQVGTVSYFTDDTSLMAGSVKQDKHFRFVQLNESINMRRCMPEPGYTWLRGCGPAPQAAHSQKVVQAQLQLPPTAPDVNTCSELQVLVS